MLPHLLLRQGLLSELELMETLLELFFFFELGQVHPVVAEPVAVLAPLAAELADEELPFDFDEVRVGDLRVGSFEVLPFQESLANSCLLVLFICSFPEVE